MAVASKSNYRRVAAKLLLATGLSIPVSPSCLAVAADQQVRQEQAVESAKYAALQELHEILTREVSTQFPPDTRVSVYLELPLSNYVLKRVSLAVDADEPVVHEYSRKQALSLIRYGADRLLRFNAGPGKHTLKIEYDGNLERPNIKDIPISDSFAVEFETKPGSQAFILPAAPKILRPVRSFADRTARENWNWKSEPEDPRLDVVRYLWDTDRRFEGILELLRVSGPGDNEKPPAGFNTLMAQVYADLGMRHQAMRAAIAAHKEEQDPVALATLWLRMAQLEYQHGRYAQAEQALNYVPADAPQMHRTVVQDLQSRILLAQHKYSQAAAVLDDATQSRRAGSDQADSQPAADQPPPYLRYNYAIALIKSGSEAQGRTELDQLGQTDAGQPILRDRANLVLGYHLLDAARGANAKPVFQRLPLSGPYTNRGLLGLGWTELISGDPQYADNAARLSRAAAAWGLLANRNPSDPAVQEALVAVPYALEQLGKYDRAAREYQHAIDTYVQISAKLSRQAKALRSGALSQAILNDDPGAIPHTGDMENIYTGYRFQAHAKNYRDLTFLGQALAERGGSKRVRTQLQQTAGSEIDAAQDELAQAIEDQLQNLKRYQIDARLGLLRNYNRKQSGASARATPTHAVQ